MRILVVFGTRPEAVKCFPVVKSLRDYKSLEVIVCVTAQHRHLLDQVLQLVDMEADYDLALMRDQPDLTGITCRVLTALGEVLDHVRPDRILVQGDTTTAMATTLAAFYRRVPVGHIEAGLRTGDLSSPWPEEANRRVITLLTDLHFAPTPQARDNLLAENVLPARIHVTGNTVVDALLDIKRRLETCSRKNPSIKRIIRQARAEAKRIVLITAHRRENWGAGIEQIAVAAARLARRGDIHIAIPVHPNPNVREPLHRALANCQGISLLEPLDYLSFIGLLRHSFVVLTDSGGVQEEAPVLGKPVLVLRDTTERPEGVAAGTARLVGLDAAQICAETEHLLDDRGAHQAMSRAVNPYGDGHAAPRIAAILAQADRPESSPSYAIHRALADATRANCA